MALSANDFGAAQPELEKAASLRPKDARILSALTYAQNGTHQYQQALETAKLVHTLNHNGMANVHYVAASAAMSLKEFDAMERELILQTLSATGNNKTRAADLLAISLKTLHNKLKEYGADRAGAE